MLDPLPALPDCHQGSLLLQHCSTAALQEAWCSDYSGGGTLHIWISVACLSSGKFAFSVQTDHRGKSFNCVTKQMPRLAHISHLTSQFSRVPNWDIDALYMDVHNAIFREGTYRILSRFQVKGQCFKIHLLLVSYIRYFPQEEGTALW